MISVTLGGLREKKGRFGGISLIEVGQDNHTFAWFYARVSDGTKKKQKQSTVR